MKTPRHSLVLLLACCGWPTAGAAALGGTAGGGADSSGDAGEPADPPQPVGVAQLRQQALGRHLEQINAAAAGPGATKLAHYLATAWDGQLPPAEEYTPAPAAYLVAVRQRAWLAALAQLRTGSHWLAEETGRWEQQPRELRMCPHCQLGVEDLQHALFVCPLYAPARARFPDLVALPSPSK